jgi:hypothetical protein
VVACSLLDMATSSVPEPSPTGEYLVGDVIADKYRLERLLGEGGQAWVWQARNLLLESPVALKVVRPDAQDPSQARRLFQEARAAARLGHPAIVRVFDLGQTASGDAFLVMELLEGESLADRLVQRERLPPVEALRVLLPIADALVTAHSQGIVHRDLKPDNVFLQREGGRERSKLLDFGVVKLQHGTAEPHLTDTGAVVGTPAYLSPEQARGRTDIDERCDVWSFCATLYECLTGELPFSGSNYNALLLSIIEEQPRSILEYDVGDERLWAILQRGLAKSAAERFQSMSLLAGELAAWLSENDVADDRSGALRKKWLAPERPGHDGAAGLVAKPRMVLAGAGAALVVAGGIGLWWPRTPVATPLAAPVITQVVSALPPASVELGMALPAPPAEASGDTKSAEPAVATVAPSSSVEVVPSPSRASHRPSASRVGAAPVVAASGPTAPPLHSAAPPKEPPAARGATKQDLDILNPY